MSRRARGEQTTSFSQIKQCSKVIFRGYRGDFENKNVQRLVAAGTNDPSLPLWVLPNGRVQCVLGWAAANNQRGLRRCYKL